MFSVIIFKLELLGEYDCLSLKQNSPHFHAGRNPLA